MDWPKVYVKKPVAIMAIEYTGGNDNLNAIGHFLTDHHWYEEDGFIYIETLEGTMKTLPGDFIIMGVHREAYPCKPDIFWETYSPSSNQVAVKLEGGRVEIKEKMNS